VPYTLLNVGMAERTTTGLRIIANPIHDLLRIVNDNAAMRCTITDAQGRLVAQPTINPGMNDLDVVFLRRGTYLIRSQAMALRFVKD